MEKNNEIDVYKSISKIDAFNDLVYEYLIKIYGERNVNNAIKQIFDDGTTNANIFKKVIGNSDNNCDRVIYDLLLPRIREINKAICDIIKSCKINISNRKLLVDKVSYASKNISDVEKLVLINKLFKEFIIIRNRICEYYLYLVDDTVKNYGDDQRFYDIYQEAVIGLLNSIERYNPSNYNFQNYALSMIRYSINHHTHDLDLCTYIPKNQKYRYYRILKVMEKYMNVHHSMPTKKELAKLMHIPVKNVTVSLSISFDEAISLSDNVMVNDEYMKLIETIDTTKDIRELENQVVDNNL